MRKLNYFQNRPKLEKIDAYAYLERLGLKRKEPSASNLRELQRHHLLAIPHENLSIHFGKRLTWDISSIFKKIIGSNRGGINLELNYLFYHLLSQLGYECYTAAAQLKHGDEFGPTYEHLVIIVDVDDQFWLVDVGLKDSLYSPKEIVNHKLQVDFNRYISLEEDVNGFWELRTSADTTHFQTIYRFRMEEAQTIEFLQMHNYYLEDPASVYRDGKYISQLFPEGRIELMDRVMRHNLNGLREETPIMNEDEFISKLEEYFSIRLTDLLQE